MHTHLSNIFREGTEFKVKVIYDISVLGILIKEFRFTSGLSVIIDGRIIKQYYNGLPKEFDNDPVHQTEIDRFKEEIRQQWR